MTAPAWKIRSSLEDPASSIKLLAEAISHFNNNGPTQDYPSLGLNAGQPIDFTNWSARPAETRQRIAWLFGGAKDDIQGRLTSTVFLQADRAYGQVIDQRLLE